MDDDSGYDDYAYEQMMTQPVDGAACIVCGREVVTWPEGLHHADEDIDREHMPML